MKKKRLLIIGTAQQAYIQDYLAKVDLITTDVHLLVPERDRGAYGPQKVSYFSGIFHPLFLPLLKVMLTFRPDEAVVVCGMTYDHDNVVKAVSFYSSFKKLEVKFSVRNNEELAGKELHPSAPKEILKWIGLGTIALLIRVISPFKKIRVGEIYSVRLGHLAMDSEIYLSEVDAGYHDNCYDLFCFKDNKVANRTLANLFCKQMKVHRLNLYLLDAIRRFNLHAKHEIAMNTHIVASGRDADCVMQLTDNHIAFSPKQEKAGIENLRDLGLPPKKEHVCIFGRDSVFLSGSDPKKSDADMQEVRDMHIRTFKPSVEELLRMDYNVIRMGSAVKEPLEISHPNFLDYATSGKRTDFMDVYLSAKCKFFVGVQSGLMHIPMIFRVPCLSVNVVRLEIILFCSPEDLAIFKLLWSKTEKRILKVPEIIESGMSRWRVEKFANSDIEVIDNTEDEILEAVKEMHERVNGTWQISKEDLELQKKFHSQFKPSYLNSKFVTPISSYFLRKHEKELF
ncbi:TIGR04372 family glycosyltransferase [Desulfovibrio gilichinskyi]|uniref:Putative glycosyltransferase, TIGR04372 family n=1 Tax=Desulfovibrio gilichinskyi TaxID=1519643 RepID=A0A1X7F352_9BACT|nr:TIGR04372 family glycosyltransferase [Desulfovibrio gilichinskyi]SMF44995.1 putative glycosyltransferase, TIGR04372 family [Desulfovibrio gilichinskyi]